MASRGSTREGVKRARTLHRVWRAATFALLGALIAVLTWVTMLRSEPSYSWPADASEYPRAAGFYFFSPLRDARMQVDRALTLVEVDLLEPSSSLRVVVQSSSKEYPLDWRFITLADQNGVDVDCLEGCSAGDSAALAFNEAPAELGGGEPLSYEMQELRISGSEPFSNIRIGLGQNPGIEVENNPFRKEVGKYAYYAGPNVGVGSPNALPVQFCFSLTEDLDAPVRVSVYPDGNKSECFGANSYGGTVPLERAADLYNGQFYLQASAYFESIAQSLPGEQRQERSIFIAGLLVGFAVSFAFEACKVLVDKKD